MHPTDERVQAALDRLRTECKGMTYDELLRKIRRTSSKSARRVIKTEMETREA